MISLKNFTIKKNISEIQLEQLVQYSKEDQDILRFTRDAQRFADVEKAKQFLEQTDVYALVDDEQLCGLIWFSKKSLPERDYTETIDKNVYTTTFAIRLYANAKGKGLSFPFMEEVFSLFKQERGIKGIWLETRVDNIRAISLYEKFGFKQISLSDNENRIIMIQF